MYLKQCYVVPLSVALLNNDAPSGENIQVFNFSIQFNWKPGGGIPFFNPFKPIHPVQASLVFHPGHKAPENYSAKCIEVYCIALQFAVYEKEEMVVG